MEEDEQHETDRRAKAIAEGPDTDPVGADCFPITRVHRVPPGALGR